ncbi:YggT family protein [Candidatus Finniella inopinata]|uniref:YggT family protein n=1 Tax=Candidatus Finniella inopinata TaxID=1696036 RepID=A0A4Q7DJB9_9PROT|nr:YggT family protein [Candidatus Finniella inopinata]RZI46953.1 YggT family protein [Candidatus Finniella inopinata]
MDVIFVPMLSVLLKVIGLYQFLVLVYIILGWLETLNIVNRYNQIVYTIHTFLFRLVEPVLNPIRRFIPNFGGIDVSPLILFFIIYFVQGVIAQILYKFPS